MDRPQEINRYLRSEALRRDVPRIGTTIAVLPASADLRLPYHGASSNLTSLTTSQSAVHRTGKGWFWLKRISRHSGSPGGAHRCVAATEPDAFKCRWPTNRCLAHCCSRSITRVPWRFERIRSGNSLQLFSLFIQSVAQALRCPGTVGTALALLLIEQMLKRVLTQLFNFNF